MFKYLRDKLKGATEDVEEETEDVVTGGEDGIEDAEDPQNEEISETTGETPEAKIEDVAEEETSETEDTDNKKGFFGKIKQKITKTKITPEKFDDIFWDVELALLQNNVSEPVVQDIKTHVENTVVDTPIPRGSKQTKILEAVEEAVEEILLEPERDLIEEDVHPHVIMLVGINGSGKTTTAAKLTKHFQDNDREVVLAAADTFRAAAIQQLEKHAEALNTKIIKHDYGADPAAVAYDAVKHAQAQHLDAVIIDTAGRLQNNKDLMNQLRKMKRVVEPDTILFIGEALTGNDCVEQAKTFDEELGVDGAIITKADTDEKGGAIISISHVTKKPIMYLGVGQDYDDLEPFTKSGVMEALRLTE